MSRQAKAPPLFDPSLADLPAELRWREWMARVEAVIFASPAPVPLDMLSPLVGSECRLDDLIADIRAELAARPYDLVFVAGGWQFRTRSRFAAAMRASGLVTDAPVADFSRTEQAVLAAIAYHQPITRAELSRLFGIDVSRDLIARLRGQALIGPGPRAPEPGAPFTYVTTSRFLSVFGLGSLRDLPDLEALEDAGLLQREPPQTASQDALDAAFRLGGAEHDDEPARDDALPDPLAS